MAEKNKPKLTTRSRSRVHPETIISSPESDESISDHEQTIGRHAPQELPTTVRSHRSETLHRREDSNIARGRLTASNGDYQDAIEEFKRVKPPTYESHYYAGCAYLQTGDRENILLAIKQFNKACRIVKGKIPAELYYKRAFAYHTIGKYVEAIMDYTCFIHGDECEAHKGYLGRGLAYEASLDYPNALADIIKANDDCPMASAYYQYCLARAYANCEHHNKSKEIYEKVIQGSSPDQFTSDYGFLQYFDRGIAFYQLDRYEEALNHFQKALQYDHTKAQESDTNLYIGLAYKALSKMDEAKRYLEKSVESNNNGRSHFHLGLIYADHDESLNEAMKYFTCATVLNPDDPDILYERGELRHKMGQLEGCVNDKRRALQLERASMTSALTMDQYELLLERFRSLFREKELKKQGRLALGWLHDRICTSAQEKNNDLKYKKHYHRAMNAYQRVLNTEEKRNYEDLIPFALMFNLSNMGGQVINAMVAWDEFSEIIEKDDSGKKFAEILEQIQKSSKERQKNLSTQEMGRLIEPITALRNGQNEAQLIDDKIIALLVDKLKPLLKIKTSQEEIQEDIENLTKEGNKNQVIFYKKMRVTLAHMFAAMAVTSGVGEEAIIKHDRTGTETIIANAVTMLGGFIGGLMPNFGGAVSGVTGFVGGQMKNDEHQRYQTRMSIIASVGDTQELNNVARRVAFTLANRYESQLLALTPRPEKKCCAFCCCCCSKSVSDAGKPKPKKEENPREHPAWQVAQFGVDCLLSRILDNESDDLKLREGMEPGQLVDILVELICQTKPSLPGKVRRALNIDGNNSIPHDFRDANAEKVMAEWHLHDFYYKPGIRWEKDGSIEKKTSWMKPEIYGYRLGTEEEYNALETLDKKKEEKKSCCC